jgi:hypothetical protein
MSNAFSSHASMAERWEVCLVTVFPGVLDEVHDDGVAVGEGHARAGEPVVEAGEQVLGRSVELDGVRVHVLQALAGLGEDALRRDAAQRGEPREPHLARPEMVQPLRQQQNNFVIARVNSEVRATPLNPFC